MPFCFLLQLYGIDIFTWKTWISFWSIRALDTVVIWRVVIVGMATVTVAGIGIWSACHTQHDSSNEDDKHSQMMHGKQKSVKKKQQQQKRKDTLWGSKLYQNNLSTSRNLPPHSPGYSSSWTSRLFRGSSGGGGWIPPPPAMRWPMAF